MKIFSTLRNTGFFIFLCCLIFSSRVQITAAENSEIKTKKMADIFTANRMLAKTINIGFTLDAPNEGDWGHTLHAGEFTLIKEAGFTAIRLPIRWSAHTETQLPFKIDPNFLERVDWAVEQALKNHLAIILENTGDDKLITEPQSSRDRFMSLWQQLSNHYKNSPPEVMFEIMAEPHDRLESAWQKYFTDALSIIRKENPTRAVIIGPCFYNSPLKLNELELPKDDRQIIVTVHSYTPVKFTMQGEDWFPFGKPSEWIGTQWLGTPAEKAEIAGQFDLVEAWAKKNRRPVFWGEFGAGDKADDDSRSRLFAFYREQAEERGFSWGFWNLTVKFSLYNQFSGKWNKKLLRALLPETPAFEPQTGSIVSNSMPVDSSVRKIDSGITAETILKKSISASAPDAEKAGGKIKDITLLGTAEINGQILTLELKYLLPSNYSEIVKFNDYEIQKTLVTNQSYVVVVQGLPQTLSEQEKEALREKTFFFTDNFLLAQKGHILTVKGITEIDGEDAYIVEVKTPTGRSTVNFYNLKTGLKVKTIEIRVNSKDIPKVETYFKNYKQFNGILIPTLVINDFGSTTVKGAFTKIEINKGLSPADFR